MGDLELLGYAVIATGVVDIVLGYTVIARVAKDDAQRRVVVAAMTLSGLALAGVGLAMVLGVFGGSGS